jgi:predicted transcriptional regulator
MNGRISAGEMRARLLAGLKRPAPVSQDWVAALGAPGNRQLLGLIGSRHPGSIDELADLAGQAQPDISRSLSALAAAGLIEVKVDGRRSVPSLTALGRAKAEELHLPQTGASNHSGN